MLPDTRLRSKLSKEQFRRVADARREVWTGGFAGLGTGAIAGAAGYFFLKAVVKPVWLAKKHGLLFTLTGAALCGFAGSIARGRRSMETLDDIYRHNSKPILPEYEKRRLARINAAQDTSGADHHESCGGTSDADALAQRAWLDKGTGSGGRDDGAAVDDAPQLHDRTAATTTAADGFSAHVQRRWASRSASPEKA